MSSSTFGLFLMILFACIGYVMKKFDYSFIAFLIGFVLAPEFEISFRSYLLMAQGDPIGALFKSPIALIFCTMTVIALVMIALTQLRRRNSPDMEIKDAT